MCPEKFSVQRDFIKHVRDRHTGQPAAGAPVFNPADLQTALQNAFQNMPVIVPDFQITFLNVLLFFSLFNFR